MGLLDLPSEILHRILIEAGPKEIARCKKTCHLLNRIINESSSLQYKIELFIAGMDDVPNPSVPTIARLRMLKEHQKAWRRLDWRFRDTFHVENADTWELLGGVVAAATTESGNFSFQAIPSIHRGILQNQWSFDLGLTMEDFTMDPSQDLLVVLGRPSGTDVMPIYVCSILDGKPHPLARSFSVPATRRNPDDSPSFMIQIYGDRVAVLTIDFAVCSLFVFEWKTGKEILRYGECVDVILSISFVDERYLLLGVLDVGNLHCALQVLDLDDDRIICELKLPVFQSNVGGIPLINIASEVPPPNAHTRAGAPFSTSRKERLFVISYVSNPSPECTFAIFLPLSSLLGLITEASAESFLIDVDWETWIPSARMIHIATPRVWVCYVQGLKAVFLDMPNNINVYDFNQQTIRQPCDSENAPPKDVDIQYATEPTRCSLSDEFFGTPISSSLPYCHVTKPLPASIDRGDVEGVMITEDAIVVVMAGGDGFDFRVLSF